MAHAFAVGNTTISAAEFDQKVALGLDPFAGEGGLEFSTDSILTGALWPAAGEATEFQPVGLGRPLSLEILGIYTGDIPKRVDYVARRPDLMTVSGIRSIETFDAAPRAINRIAERVPNRALLEPSALDPGCPVIYYTPSLTDDVLFCTVELKVQAFSADALRKIAGLLATGAGLPIFTLAQTALFVGSQLVPLIADLAEALVQTKPFLSEELRNLRFDTPGFARPVAKLMPVYRDEDERELRACEVGVVEDARGSHPVMVDRQTKTAYTGGAPYLIISIDGRTRTNLDGFTSKLATAALLEKFYGKTDAGSKAVEALGSAMELYNDYDYRERARNVSRQLQALDPKSANYEVEKARLECLLGAYVGNIRNSLFKPS